MKVIGAGFGCTGTESLQVALEQLLEGRCYHMKEVFGNAEDLARWEAFGRAERQNMDWESLLRSYRAGVDWPLCNYYEDLLQAFPDARVILTVRDPDRWFEGFQKLVKLYRVAKIFSPFVPRLRRLRRMVDATVWHAFEDLNDRASAVGVFNRHIEQVKATVPAEQLLVFDVKEGWEPLCDFLNCEIPSEPFPRMKKGVELRGIAQRVLKNEFLRAARIPALIVISGAAAAFWFKKRRGRP